jgi:L-rhamnose mutarotase
LEENTVKTMTCRQLGGARDKEFHAETFDEMAELSKKHGVEMFQKGDENHIKAMSDAKERMKNPDALSKWFENKKNLKRCRKISVNYEERFSTFPICFTLQKGRR